MMYGNRGETSVSVIVCGCGLIPAVDSYPFVNGAYLALYVPPGLCAMVE